MIESDFEKKTAKYRPKKNDGFLPVFLQCFIPKLVYELVKIKQLLSTSDDMLKALWTAPESGPKRGLEPGAQDGRQTSGLSRGKVRSRDGGWQGYSIRKMVAHVTLVPSRLWRVWSHKLDGHTACQVG